MRKGAHTYVNEILSEGFVHTMTHGGFSASLMKAPRLKDIGRPHGLPPGERIPVIPISSLPGSPDSWSREAGAYVCPVDTDRGIWFDFTMNDRMNTAVLPSVKGLNPITGRPLDGPCLESYQNRCPVHDEPFGHDLLCEKCGFRWPTQNYVTHESTLWLDGFRQPDGTVRQFFFTEDDKKDIASLVMGKQNTMPAFGFVFYEPKEKRREPQIYFREIQTKPFAPQKNSGTPWWGVNTDHAYYAGGTTEADDCFGMGEITGDLDMSDGNDCLNYCSSVDLQSSTTVCNTSSLARGMSFTSNVSKSSPLRSKSVRTASVGAGAEIKQDIRRDELGIDGWKEEPSSIIRLYFCFEEQFRQIVEKGGVTGIQTKSSGFLDGLPVG